MRNEVPWASYVKRLIRSAFFRQYHWPYFQDLEYQRNCHAHIQCSLNPADMAATLRDRGPALSGLPVCGDYESLSSRECALLKARGLLKCKPTDQRRVFMQKCIWFKLQLPFMALRQIEVLIPLYGVAQKSWCQVARKVQPVYSHPRPAMSSWLVINKTVTCSWTHDQIA